MERKLSRRQTGSRAGISRALTAVAVVALAVALSPVAGATSLVPEEGALTQSSSGSGAGSIAIEEAQEKQLEILYQEFNWWELWSLPSNAAVFDDEDVDDLFAHMEQNPSLYTDSNESVIAQRWEGSNTLSDYRSPGHDSASSREIHASLREGFLQGHVSNPDQGSATHDAGSPVIGSAGDYQFIEENVNFGLAFSLAPGPGEGLNDFRFIEENTILPGGQAATDDVAPAYTGTNERAY